MLIILQIDKYRREVEEARIAQEKEDLLERVRQEGHIKTEKVCWQGFLIALDSLPISRTKKFRLNNLK